MSASPQPPISEQSAVAPDASAVVAFWKEAGPARWFAKDDAFDARFRDTFHVAHGQAAARELDAWVEHAEGALALMVLLDQYPRNAFRGTAHMFATDPLARFFADRIVKVGLDKEVDVALRSFCYLPFEHSENPQDQERSLALYAELGGDSYKWAKLHADIITRFGRFPHRNDVLGRVSTAEEIQFLNAGGFAG